MKLAEFASPQHCCCALFWTFTYGTYKERSPGYSMFTWALNPFTTGNPFWGQNLLGNSIGRGSGALKGLTRLLLSILSRGGTFHFRKRSCGIS